ncbi:type III-B CRISPR-associated protein Cas10/Cmr2 [Herpetosiphon gulosus]|uniref:GGDEF domain-containing protein n=1 Tax=Herpetosiphon gulosus TaxID=1973496 RepID=A0ABP9WYC6_9CHLR
MSHLILIAIGPVQDFIASARRTRDLWFGSWLLSELSKAVAKSVYQAKGNLIFPYPTDPAQDLAPNSAFNVPNKILAKVEGDVKMIADAAKQALDTRVNEIRDGAFAKVTGVFDQTRAKAQIAALIEFSWVALHLASDDVYCATREQLEHLMAARKNTRNFSAVTWGTNAPKSSIDGERESVIDNRELKGQELTMYREYGINIGEHLSGVDILKRHGQKGVDSRFPSTSHIAATPVFNYLTLLDQSEKNPKAVTRLWKDYICALKLLESAKEYIQNEKTPIYHDIFEYYDGSLLFAERFNDALVGEDLKKAQKYLQDFLKPFLDTTIPIPYYAILHADGDAMGRFINTAHGMDEHQGISEKLTRFAGNVKSIVENHQGALVYSGGDDVLAFLPLTSSHVIQEGNNKRLATVFDCAADLATAFKQALVDPMVSLSVGIAIVHHLEPLSDALDLARKAEQQAKGIKGKNALAINLSKRGGADRIIAGSWAKPEGQFSLYERLTRLIELHQYDQIPLGFAFELHDLSIRLKDLPASILRAEAKRIIERKYTSNGKKVEDDIAEQLLKMIDDLLLDQTTKPHSIIQQFADEVIIAEFIAEAQKLANGN